jgi:hypothetical protein
VARRSTRRDCLPGAGLAARRPASDDAAGEGRASRLQTVGSLMEKESRVASWGVRTVTGPILPAAGVLTYLALDTLIPALGEEV